MFWKKFQVRKLNKDYIIYKKYQNKVIKEIRKAKRSLEEKFISKY